jgi:NAD(P)H-dependent FMN reductase
VKIIAFGASNSKTSINKQLASYAASLVKNAQVEVLDLNDYELPLFSVDLEQEIGEPEHAKHFFEKITNADALVISFAEHNGSYSAVYKNLLDWCSRINVAVFQDKSAVFLATSLGPGGANSVLQTAIASAPFFGADIKGSFSLPSFYENFDLEKQLISNVELQEQLANVMKSL